MTPAGITSSVKTFGFVTFLSRGRRKAGKSFFEIFLLLPFGTAPSDTSVSSYKGMFYINKKN